MQKHLPNEYKSVLVEIFYALIKIYGKRKAKNLFSNLLDFTFGHD